MDMQLYLAYPFPLNIADVFLDEVLIRNLRRLFNGVYAFSCGMGDNDGLQYALQALRV
jgi:hypothetical protein